MTTASLRNVKTLLGRLSGENADMLRRFIDDFEEDEAARTATADAALSSMRAAALAAAPQPDEPILCDACGKELRDDVRVTQEPVHTCFRDDGGTPNRRCHACEAEAAAAPQPQKDGQPSALLQAREHLALAIEERLPHKHVELSIDVAEETLRAIDAAASPADPLAAPQSEALNVIRRLAGAPLASAPPPQDYLLTKRLRVAQVNGPTLGQPDGQWDVIADDGEGGYCTLLARFFNEVAARQYVADSACQTAPPSAWQPMDSCPNEEVLMYRPRLAPRHRIAIRRAGDWCGQDCCPDSEPTHWQPLPSPPPASGPHT